MVRDRRRRRDRSGGVLRRLSRSTVTAGAAHDPAMMVALLLYAYAIGERSSRRIERRCVEDVAFRVIAANQAPDHATIARFRQRHETALGGAVRRGAGALRRGGPGRRRGDRGRRHQDARQRVAARHARLRADRRARSSRRPPRSTRPRTSSSASARGDELPAELRDRAGPARLAARGQAAPGRRSAPQEARPIPRLAAGAAAGGQAPARGGARRRASRQRRLRGLPRARA